MRNAICIVALCFAAAPLSAVDEVAASEETTDGAKVSDKEKAAMEKAAKKEKAATAKLAKKEKAAKAKLAAQEKAKNAQRDKVLQALGPRQDGHFLLAFEEVTGTRVSGVKIVVKTISSQGERAAVGNEIIDFGQGAGTQSRRAFQVLARFHLEERGSLLAKSHQAMLQGFVDARLKNPVFSTEACYSDLAPNAGQTINQGLANGTIVRYYPLK